MALSDEIIRRRDGDQKTSQSGYANCPFKFDHVINMRVERSKIIMAPELRVAAICCYCFRSVDLSCHFGVKRTKVVL